MKSNLFVASLLVVFSSLVYAQDTASLAGTVRDKSGAIVPNASVVVSNPATSSSRAVTSNGDGEYLAAALPAGAYNVVVTAQGFRKFEAKGVVLRVAQKSRIDVTLEVGTVSTEVVVQGEGLTNVETESSEMGGTITGKQITQLELNGRNFTQLITLIPGVSNQTGQDEGTVGVFGNVQFSVNGGRTEYNNWEIDGGDSMDNGSNSTLNVYPSLDAIAEFRVLTSNYGAQYGRNGSGTVEVQTKSGTKSFHGDAYEFVRNDIFNARNFFQSDVPSYKKNDFGYTLGGPIFIPGHYNSSKDKSFFFWSEEWRKDRLPTTFSGIHVPSMAERQGNFNDLCPNPTTGSNADCPTDPNTGLPFPGNQVPVNPNGQALLALIPTPTGGVPGATFFSASPSFPTNWREELVKIDHNINSKELVTFRFIHDSWDTITPTPLWTNGGTFPTSQTAFRGPGVSLVSKLTTSASPTLLNEFVFSYTADHIFLTDVGAFKRPSSVTINGLFGNGTAGKLPGISLAGGGIYSGISQDPGFHPEGLFNSNPTYTFRDNISKVLGKHTLQTGFYFVAAQKNELGGEPGSPGGATNGFLTFDSTSPVTTGNAFADLLVGNIASFGQQNQQIKYYNRYKIFEPYIQDDWHIRKNLTLNVGLRLSLFGTYNELNRQAFNFDPSKYVQGATVINPDGTVGGNPFNGLVQCGKNGVPSGCLQGHLFNPAPRLGFAWDPFGQGKTAIRGGYGVFFEHTNGNEANTESLENSPPGVQVPVQFNVSGYNNLGTAPGSFLPVNVISIPKNAVWPYVQQWHLDFQQEIVKNTVATISYVGSKGTHLSRLFDMNQLAPVPLSQNPYRPGEAISQNECNAIAAGTPVVTPIGGVPITGQALTNLTVACGNSPNPFRPFQGFGDILRLEDTASSSYHALQASLRRSVGKLQLSASYTWSHSIDDSSDRFDAGFVNSFNLGANRASSNFDQRHVFNLSYVYDLPFFQGQGLANKLLGGWQWSGITTFQTGTPFTVT
ncbi:MAG TPA: carboxypeptidase regulatory-like domain-containing protein, partial [Candidatus Angelobacter sp.]|nr:carboxypeptidase regulatory-like domain-containing protein [Candidatus Angelobacter sp.]